MYAGEPQKVCLVSLGCDKNLSDSEKALSLLLDAGYDYTPEPSEADVIIVNTCCFIGDARDESIEMLIRMADLKSASAGRPPFLVVMGCMAERYGAGIREALPETDLIVGTDAWYDIVSLTERAKKGENPDGINDAYGHIPGNVFVDHPVTKRFLTGLGYYAYLKIAEGCSKGCTYCIIPSIRGPYKSVPMGDLEREALYLSKIGVRELILVAQETTLYGRDLYGRKMLTELLATLSEIEGLRWIRLLYCYPEEIDDELIAALKTLPKVCHYLDMPVQSASDHILRRMHRQTTNAEIREKIADLRRQIPDIALRTTFIAGFPGETERDHEETLDFIRDMRFDRLGAFKYSKEEGTPAASYSHQVSAAVKQLRYEEIMLTQQEIAFEKAASLPGRRMEAIIEGRLSNAEAGRYCADGDIYIGRTYMDAPDVDGYIFIEGVRRKLMTGDIVTVSVSGAEGYDLRGRLV